MKKGKENNNANNPKDKVDPNKKQQGIITKNPKDLLPPNSQYAKNIRETFPLKQTEITAEENKEIKEMLIFSKPFEILPEWPNEEELKVFSSTQESERELFTDPFNKRILFPSKFEENFANEAKWLRPQEYIKNNMLNKEIKISFPNKNIHKTRNEIKEFYMTHELPNRQPIKESMDNNNNNQDNDEENYYLYDKHINNFQFNTEAIDKSNFADKTQTDILEILHKKRNSFKDCFKILDKKTLIKIVNWSEREETDEEFKKRKDEEAQEKLKKFEKEKDSKNKKKPANNAAANKPLQQAKDQIGNLDQLNFQFNSDERLKIKEIKPSNLYLLNEPKYNSYVKWILSIMQMVKDLNLSDAQTGKSIIANIYPQKDGFPIASASGKYWIKLYLMGKARLVEIDDLIPCNKNEDFIFPRCDRLDEIWPALLTKAILKLHSHKRLSKYCEETGDLSVLYSLTGFIVEKLLINSMRVLNIEKYLQSNENYLQMHKIIACMAWKEEEEIIIEKRVSPAAAKNDENSKIKKLASIKSINLNSNFNKMSSKKSIVSVYNNLDQIPEEMQKTEKDDIEHASLKKKRNSSITSKKKKLSNSKINSYLSNPNQIKAFAEKTIIGTPNNENNYVNFLKNIPEENNFDLDDKNFKEINEDNKINESSAFNSVNNENTSQTNDQNNNNNNQALNEFNSYPKEKNSFLITPKNQEFGSRLKNTFSDIKANKFDLLNNRPRRSSVAFLFPKGKEELKIENSISNKNNNNNNNDTEDDDPTNKYNKQSNKENLLFNTNEVNISPEGKYETEGQTGQKFLVSLGRNEKNILKTSKNIIKFDFNLELTEKTDSQKRDDILSNYLYPILDFFDNKKFNMQRLKPLDFSDIKKLGQEGRTPGIYKQLSKEDKKKYLENLLEVQTKQREMKNKRIEEIVREGRKYNFIKIKNNTIGIPKLELYIPYTEQEILMTKKCLENKWDFPPPAYYDNYAAENKGRNESTLILTETNADDLTKSPKKDLKKVEKSPKKSINKTNSPVREKNRNKDLIEAADANDKFNLEDEHAHKENFKEEASLNEIDKGLLEEKLEQNKDSKAKAINKKKSTWSKEVYLNIIDHNLEQFENSIEPLAKYNGGNWLNYSEFKKYFNFFILLHHPKSFKCQNSCDNLWSYNNDCYEYNKNTSVIFLNNLSEKFNENLNDEGETDVNNFENKEILNTKRERMMQQKKSTLLILFEPNHTNFKSAELEELFYYANFDLIDSYGKEIQNNIILSKFYSTYLNENLEKEKNYFLILKSFVCPFGFNFSVYSDHACDSIDYGTYLKKFYSFENKVFKIDHTAFQRNKTSLIAKFKIKLIEKTYFKINLDYSDKLSKKFMEIYLFFGRSTQNKKRINFDLNEKILFEPLPGQDEFILALVVNPPYVINSNSIEVDFYYDRSNAKIELLDTYEPFKLYDRIKANKYGIVFKEFIFAFENTYITFELKIQNRVSFNFSEDANHNLNPSMKSSKNITNLIQNANVNNKNSNNNLNIAENMHNQNLESLKISEEDLKEKLRMKLQISKSNELIFEEEFFNKITIQNMLLNYEPNTNLHNSDSAVNLNLNLTNQKTSNNVSSAQMNNLYTKETQPYLMVCVLDLSELKIPKESLENLDWILRVFASEPVVFTKDTSKEDSEKFLKDNWEHNEIGRSEKARKSRLKHLIMCKKNMGKILSPDEQQLLLEERPKTVATASMLQHLESNNLKAAKENEKDKKGIKEINKKVISNAANSKQTNNTQQKTNKNLPKLDANGNGVNEAEASSKSLLKLDFMKRPVIAKPSNHKNHSIKDFLHYTIQERIIQKDNLIEHDKKIVLNEHSLKKINEQINKQVDYYETIRKTEGDETLNRSILSRENLKTFYKTTNTFRVQARDNCSQLYKQRDLLRNDLIKVIEIENCIEDILSNFNIDFNYSIGIYRESANIEGVKPKLRERLFQFISSKKDEFYKTEIKKLTNKDKNVISKYVEDIENNKWFVSPEIMIKFKELIHDTNSKK